ncbi:YezD family protein [Coraliomargarita parva]|uniref:YezD family protein n=1 Tax=Coraliomargarita parva TaxID=3014050 RepID=UPI0022B41D64|nr:YezD family protein [Coraliomargarita parva]
MKTNSIQTPSRKQWMEIVAGKVAGIRFGVVQIVVHEGKVTQIEVTEKTRLEDRSPASNPLG